MVKLAYGQGPLHCTIASSVSCWRGLIRTSIATGQIMHTSNIKSLMDQNNISNGLGPCAMRLTHEKGAAGRASRSHVENRTECHLDGHEDAPLAISHCMHMEFSGGSCTHTLAETRMQCSLCLPTDVEVEPNVRIVFGPEMCMSSGRTIAMKASASSTSTLTSSYRGPDRVRVGPETI